VDDCGKRWDIGRGASLGCGLGREIFPRSAAGNIVQVRHRAAEGGQLPGALALALAEGFERFPKRCSFLCHTGIMASSFARLLVGLKQQRTHVLAQTIKLTSIVLEERVSPGRIRLLATILCHRCTDIFVRSQAGFPECFGVIQGS
jgi:hypothetical protein